MLKTIISLEPKKIFFYTLSIFLTISLVYFLIAFVVQINIDSINKEKVTVQETLVINAEKDIISDKVNRLISDLLYVTNALKIDDDGNGNYSNVEKHWLAFSSDKVIYDQIRFIDLNGNEVIRVNYETSGATLRNSEDLQNKADRYYFTETISLSKNQVYISKLDLNVENGQIEEPIMPMIRLATPYYDNNGEIKGIVVLNYSADDILSQVDKIASTSHGDIFMLNSDGYWLANSGDSSQNWAFMYDDRLNESFKSEFATEWQSIQATKSGSLISDNGVFNYTNIPTVGEFVKSGDQVAITGAQKWIIVSYISPESEYGLLLSANRGQTVFKVFQNNIGNFLFIFVFSLFLGILLTIYKIRNDEIKYFSEYDIMTGIYNRRTGFEKLALLSKNVEKNKSTISVCFIDINGLKEVNDHLGHDAGDELILTITTVIKNNIRENDFVARLGGDEFLIIFEGLDETASELVWQRIVGEFETINQNDKRLYIISVSHGIEVFIGGSNEYIDTIINLADEKMYQEKKVLKKDLQIIREH